MKSASLLALCVGLTSMAVSAGAAIIPAASGTVGLTVYTDTGDSQLVFNNVTIGGYEIDSVLGELVPANWKTLNSQGYSGFGTLGSTNNLLSEGNLTGTLTYTGNIDIGNIFNTATTPANRDLVFSFLDSNFNQTFVPVTYTTTNAPEPVSASMMALASVGLLARRRKA